MFTLVSEGLQYNGTVCPFIRESLYTRIAAMSILVGVYIDELLFERNTEPMDMRIMYIDYYCMCFYSTLVPLKYW